MAKKWKTYHLMEIIQIKKSFKLSSETLFLAVRTRLELVTPCVTGMYSNLLN